MVVVRPSRLNPNYKDDNLTVFKPFSQGPRGCPGEVMALAAVRLFIANVVWQYDLEVVHGQKVYLLRKTSSDLHSGNNHYSGCDSGLPQRDKSVQKPYI